MSADWSFGALGESDSSPSVEDIAAYTGFRLDGRARDVYARIDQVLTKRTVFLRFSMEPADFDALIGLSPFPELSEEATPALLLADPRPTWFHPESASHFLAGELDRAAILVDTSSPSNWTVFVVSRS